MTKITRAERTVVVRGIELPYPAKIYPGYPYPDWSSERDPETNYPMGELWHEPRELFEAGTAFVPLDLLEELLEADNSWGLGGAFLINDRHVQWALECEGLIHVETRGGVHTDPDQRRRLRELLGIEGS